MDCILRIKDLRYLAETIWNFALSVNEAFYRLEEQFMTLANMDTNPPEWNSLKFSGMKTK